jgi:hypothetical protein
MNFLLVEDEDADADLPRRRDLLRRRRDLPEEEEEPTRNVKYNIFFIF